tara:strand:+ start:3837 stop:5126 length:1290 start_codon:yes stop_codon:yes gene_type:complete
MAEKSLVEQALLEAKTIEESVKQSAKEILPSVLKKEINDLVKESINEVDEIDLDSETLDITDDEMDMGPMGDMKMDSVELDLTKSSDDEVMKVFKKMGPEDEIEVVKTGDGVTLTDGNEEYEIKNVSEGKKNEPIYEIELDDDMNEMMDKKMEEGGAKKGDQSATRSDYKNYKGTDKGYRGKTGSSHGDQGDPEDYMKEMYGKKRHMEMKDEQMYEIELDGEEELEEASMARTFAHGKRASSGTRKGLPKASVVPNKALAKKLKESKRPQRTVSKKQNVSPRVIKENKMLRGTLSKYGEEVKSLKGKNEEYKKALSLFREKLNEVAVFNSNLAYTTKLFTDHSTTKKEKLNILSRFDEVNSLKESKSLYKQINSEVGTGKKPIQEVIRSKGGTRVITESNNKAKNSIIRENKIYQDPQMKRMMDLMKKI